MYVLIQLVRLLLSLHGGAIWIWLTVFGWESFGRWHPASHQVFFLLLFKFLRFLVFSFLINDSKVLTARTNDEGLMMINLKRSMGLFANLGRYLQLGARRKIIYLDFGFFEIRGSS